MESPKITKWEYGHDEVEGELYDNRVDRVLDEWGQDGWDVIGGGKVDHAGGRLLTNGD